MSIIKLMSVEYDTEKMELTGGMSGRIEDVLTKEEKIKVVDAIEIVAEAFNRDINGDGKIDVEKKKSYEAIKGDEIEEVDSFDIDDCIRGMVSLLGIEGQALEMIKEDIINGSELSDHFIKESGLTKKEFLEGAIQRFEEIMNNK